MRIKLENDPRNWSGEGTTAEVALMSTAALGKLAKNAGALALWANPEMTPAQMAEWVERAAGVHWETAHVAANYFFGGLDSIAVESSCAA